MKWAVDNLKVLDLKQILKNWSNIKHIKMLNKMPEEIAKLLKDTVVNKSKKYPPPKQQLYSHLPPISQTIQVRYAGHCCRGKDKLVSES